MKSHIESVHTVQKFACKQCYKVYIRVNTLKGHVKMAHEGKHFCCSYENCDEKFLRKDDLNNHLLAHEGKFHFICHLSGKGYNHKASYNNHSNMHLGYKIFKCSKCSEYSTNYVQDLNRHLQVCDVKPTIPCTFEGCPKKFSCKGYLRDNIK